MKFVRKSHKNSKDKVGISHVYVGRQMGEYNLQIKSMETYFHILLIGFFFSVLRSQSKLLQKSKIKIQHCFVAIEPNFHAISLNWLQRTQPLSPAPLAVQNEAGPSNIQGGGASNNEDVPNNQVNENTRTGRRMSVASCRNLFDVDGRVEGTGFDFLNHVSSKNRGDLVDNRKKGNDFLDEALTPLTHAPRMIQVSDIILLKFI